MRAESISLAINVLRSTLDYIGHELDINQTDDAVREYKLATTRLIAHLAAAAPVPIVEDTSPKHKRP
jgi:hypothetical protein